MKLIVWFVIYNHLATMIFANKPDRAVFELTNRCNLKCKMCDIWKEEPKREFGLDLFEKIVKDRAFSKIKFISLTGGEPFLMDNLEDYYSVTRKYAPNSYLDISTNGFFTSRTIKFLKNVDTKTTSITISYDGIKSHDTVRGQVGSAATLLKTANQVKKNFPGVGLSLKYTITPMNYDELLSTAKQARDMDISFRFKIMEVLKCAHTRYPGDKPEFKANEIELIVKQAKTILTMGIKTNRKYIKSLTSSGKKLTCNWPEKKVFIGIDGKVWLCRKMEPIGCLTNTFFDTWFSEQRSLITKKMKQCKDIDCSSFCFD